MFETNVIAPKVEVEICTGRKWPSIWIKHLPKILKPLVNFA